VGRGNQAEACREACQAASLVASLVACRAYRTCQAGGHETLVVDLAFQAVGQEGVGLSQEVHLAAGIPVACLVDHPETLEAACQVENQAEDLEIEACLVELEADQRALTGGEDHARVTESLSSGRVPQRP